MFLIYDYTGRANAFAACFKSDTPAAAQPIDEAVL